MYGKVMWMVISVYLSKFLNIFSFVRFCAWSWLVKKKKTYFSALSFIMRFHINVYIYII